MAPTPYAFRLPADVHVPAEVFLRLAPYPGIAWLDSSLARADDGRFSILAAAPAWTFEMRAGEWTTTSRVPGDPGPGLRDGLGVFEALLRERRAAAPAGADHLPFFGGAIGWLSYDLGRTFEDLPTVAADDLRVPDLHFAWYDHALVWDHATAELWAVGLTNAAGAEEPGAVQEKWLSNREAVEPGLPAPRQPEPPPLRALSNLTRAQYLAAVEAARAGIARGEYYQLNLVQRFTTEPRDPPAHTYLRLRGGNPAPFAAYLDCGDITILSSSPERFIEVSPRGEIRTFPIKGTRPRGQTPAEDARLREELLASPKENAELLMIVDLLRNDLGRVCTPGSVTAPRRGAVESFATVHHLVAEVAGQLRAEVGWRDLLRAVFPGGSITGAPKVSAMKAIEHLEPHRRGIAMGAIGYVSAHGRMDLSIAIRTIICTGGRAHLSVGAGIVWDSQSAAEYDETLAKGKALFAALHATPDTT